MRNQYPVRRQSMCPSVTDTWSSLFWPSTNCVSFADQQEGHSVPLRPWRWCNSRFATSAFIVNRCLTTVSACFCTLNALAATSYYATQPLRSSAHTAHCRGTLVQPSVASHCSDGWHAAAWQLQCSCMWGYRIWPWLHRLVIPTSALSTVFEASCWEVADQHASLRETASWSIILLLLSNGSLLRWQACLSAEKPLSTTLHRVQGLGLHSILALLPSWLSHTRTQQLCNQETLEY